MVAKIPGNETCMTGVISVKFENDPCPEGFFYWLRPGDIVTIAAHAELAKKDAFLALHHS